MDTAARSNRTMRKDFRRKAGMTLMELLCVLAILGMLMALYLPAIARAYLRVRRFLEGMS